MDSDDVQSESSSHDPDTTLPKASRRGSRGLGPMRSSTVPPLSTPALFDDAGVDLLRVDGRLVALERGLDRQRRYVQSLQLSHADVIVDMAALWLVLALVLAIQGWLLTERTRSC